MSQTGALLKKHRERLGMSQGDLAEAAGVSRGVISETESGDLPKLSILVQIRDGLRLEKKKWLRFLAVYLVECGAILDDDPIVPPALPPGAGSRTLALHALRLECEKMPLDELGILANFTELLVRHPYLFPAVAAFVKFEAQCGSPPSKNGPA